MNGMEHNFLNGVGSGDPYGIGQGWDPIFPNPNLGQCSSYTSSNPCPGPGQYQYQCNSCWFGYFTTQQTCESQMVGGDWSGFGGMPYTTGANSPNPYYGCLDPLATNYMGNTNSITLPNGTIHTYSNDWSGVVSDPSLCEYELYRCGHCSTPCTAFMIQNNPGLCQYDNTADCIQGCDSQTADIERWTCMGPDKFGNQQGCRLCTQYEIDNAAPNLGGVQGTPYGCKAQGGHATQQACEFHLQNWINSGSSNDWYGCGGPKKIEPSKEPSIDLISPVTTDPQDQIDCPCPGGVGCCAVSSNCPEGEVCSGGCCKPSDTKFGTTLDEPEIADEPIDYIPDPETPIDNSLMERMKKLAGIK
jgi:hypothetical protein